MAKEEKVIPTGRIRIPNCRLSFVDQLWEKGQVNGQGDPAHNCSFIITPDHPMMKTIKAKLKAVAKEKWGTKADVTYADLEKKDKIALHDGDNKTEWDGYEGNFYITARSPTMPTIVNKRPKNDDGSPNLVSKNSGIIYAGCMVVASLDFWAQDNKYGKRINATLRGVQYEGPGDAFAGGRPADAEEFDDLSDGADAETEVESEDDDIC